VVYYIAQPLGHKLNFMTTNQEKCLTIKVRPKRQKLSICPHFEWRCFERGINVNTVIKLLIDNPLEDYFERIVAIHWDYHKMHDARNQYLLIVIKQNRLITSYFLKSKKLRSQSITNLFQR
jgi:hypothetical protein